jgi:hypothetical protein
LVAGGGCLVLDVGLLEDSLRLPTEWFEDRDGLPALAGQQVWGVGTVDYVVAWVVDAGAMVDGEGTFGNVVGVQGLLEASIVRWPSVSLIITVAGRPWQGPC